MGNGFYFDMTACIGCRTCQVACKDKNDLEMGVIFRRLSDFEVGEYPAVQYLPLLRLVQPLREARVRGGLP